MLRLHKVINQMKSVNTDNMVHKISDKYVCRFVKPSDYNAIYELTANVFGGHDWIPGSFFRLLSDNKLMFIGVEYKPESKIVVTAMIKVVDDGITGIGCGYRTHPKHRRKGLFVALAKWQNNLIPILYPNIKRIRATTYSSNIPSIKVQAKSQGLIPIKRDNFIKMLYGHIVYSTADDYYKSILTPTKFLRRLNDVVQQNQITFEVIYDVDCIVDILKHKYNKHELFIDWKIFDLSIGINDIKKYLLKEIQSKRLKVVSNPNRSCLGMIYIDERPKLIQLHIYGLTNDHTYVIALMNKLFTEWKNEKDQIADINDLTCYLMIDEALNNNAKMNHLCKGFDSIVITEKYL